MKDITKEELIRIYEDQIAGIQRLSDVKIPNLNDPRQYPYFRININYGVSGADVLHPDFQIGIYVNMSDNDKTYQIESQLIDSVEISNEEGERLIEKLNLAVERLKEKKLNDSKLMEKLRA